MISRNQYPNFTLSIAGVIGFLLLISPLSLFSQDSSPPSPDFDGNGIVDLPDFLLFVDVFGSKEGDEKYDAKYDLDGNGEIGVGDFLLFMDSFGKTLLQVTISAGTTPVTEGTSATFTITASSAPTSALTVNVDVSEDGDVISGTPPSSVTINANAATATLTIATDDDEADESNSVITAEVETGTGYTVGSTSSASVTVADNDDSTPPPITSITPSTPSTTAGGSTGDNFSGSHTCDGRDGCDFYNHHDPSSGNTGFVWMYHRRDWQCAERRKSADWSEYQNKLCYARDRHSGYDQDHR